jgi:asparagine synthase (glutamine-hydrolysing)
VVRGHEGAIVCGIVGIFGNDFAHRRDELLAATDRLAHRGPDGGGFWHEPPFVFGHRRLSIIDLSLGAQPMADSSGRYVITYNGEIYNYLELRTELEARGARFRTRSDTEVILEAYRHYGVKAASKLVGMFAIAIADRLERTLYLARDRLGEKPLYLWTAPSGDVVFASELKAITGFPDFRCEIEPIALGGFLVLNYVPGDATLLRGVERLAPGTWHLLHLDGRREKATYWTPASRETINERTPVRGTAALDEIAKRLDAAVHIALRSDVPVTLFLSGGIDSSLVAESATRQGYLRHAYCLDFNDPRFSEWRNAKAVADRLGLELRRAVARPLDPAGFERLVYHADDPLADSSALAVDALACEVAADYKVVISGDGGDELFGGYLTYQATALYRLLHRLVPAAGAHFLVDRLARATDGAKVSAAFKARRFLRAWGQPPAVAHFTWNGTWLPDEAVDLLAPELRPDRPVDAAVAGLVARSRLTTSPRLRALQMADMREYLPNDILTKVDRITMAHGLESRAPFLNPMMAEFGVALEDHEKIRLGGKPKRLLRAAAARIFPQQISAAKKQGFSIPVHAWLRREMRESLELFLSRERLGAVPFLDADEVLAQKDRHLAGAAELGFELWGLMALSAWWQNHRRPLPTSRGERADVTRLALPPFDQATTPSRLAISA